MSIDKIKYEVSIFNRNSSEQELLNDLLLVAKTLKINKLSAVDYNKLGKYHSSTIINRFNGWNNALIKAGLEIKKNNLISRNKLIADLKNVSKLLQKDRLTQEDYLLNGCFSIHPFIREFGNWFNALESADLKKTRNYKVTNDQYFENIERIWISLGRQPKYKEIEKPFSTYSAGAYERRFGTWSNALKEFAAFMNSDVGNVIEKTSLDSNDEAPLENNIRKHITDRNINLRIRFHTLSRDNFMCVKCGRRPPEVKLQVDHIYPYSKGGETLPDNLQTLCDECNNGKSNVS